MFVLNLFNVVKKINKTLGGLAEKYSSLENFSFPEDHQGRN